MKDKWITHKAWLPEALPKYSGFFAPANYKVGKNTLTTDPWAAMQFKTKKECERWCKDNPDPPFIAAEHGFAEAG